MQVFAAVGTTVAGVLPGKKDRRKSSASHESSEDQILRSAHDSLKLSLKCTPSKSFSNVKSLSVRATSYLGNHLSAY